MTSSSAADRDAPAGTAPLPGTPPANGEAERDRLVLVGTRYSALNPTWNEHPDATFEDVCAQVAERFKDQKANGHPSEVIEVIVVRKAQVKADITISEVDVTVRTVQ